VITRWHAQDVAAYRTLRLEALDAAPTAFGTDPTEEAARTDAELAAMLESSVVLVAGDMGGMVGLGFETMVKRRHLGLIWGVYVRAERRGEGLGCALLHAAIDAARGRVDRLWLSVTVGNAPALALYRAAGFSIYGTEPAALRVDGVDHDEHLMTCDLRKTSH